MSITTPYKNNTVSSVSGTTFNSNGTPFTSGDVGRLIILTDGSGKLQHRKIVSFTDTNTVEVDHAWDSTPWLDTVADVNPSNGDAFCVSYLQSDSAFTGEAGVTVSGEQISISAIELTGDAYVHIINAQIDLASDGVEIGENAGVIFGWYKYIAGEDAQVKDSCHIIDNSSTGTGGNQMGRGVTPGADFGMLDIYGGTVLVEQSTVFWRTYNDGGSANCQIRWINISAFGGTGLGSRTDGDRSILIATQVGARTTVGISNPRAAVSRVSLESIDCDQAGYVFLDIAAGGPSGRLIFPRLNTINSKIIRCVATGHSGTNIMEVIAKKSEVDQVATFINSSGNPSGTHIFRYGNFVNPSIFDATATLITEDIKTALIDNTSTIVNSPTVSDGIYPEFFTRHTDIVTATGDLTLADGTGYGPYKLNLCEFNKLILSQSLNIEDVFDAPLTMLDDTSMTESIKAIVDAYTELETANKIYDACKSYLFDNYAGELLSIVARSGLTIDARALDVVFDATATPIVNLTGNTLTLKCDNYSDGIETTGTVTAINGADISLASISSASGVNTKITISDLSSSNIFIRDDSDLQYDYQAGITGQYQITTPVGASGIWKVVIDRAGYASQVFTFTAGAGDVSYSGALGQLFQPSGSAMYTGSSNPLLSVVPETDASRLNIRIGDGTVTAQEIFDESEDALSTATGMHYLANGGQRVEIALLPTGTFLFMRDNVRLIRDTAGDANATVEAFVTSTQGTILDNTNGGVQFVTVTRAQQLIEYGGHIYIDVDAGTNSSVYPFGTQANPVNSWDNAKVLCEFYGLRDVRFTGTMMHTSDAVGYAIDGSDAGAILVLQGYDISKSKFLNIIATGDAGNPAQGVQFRGCYVEGVTNFNGVMDEVIFTGSVTVTGERNYLTRCSSAVVDDDVVVLSINNAGQCTTSVRDFYGRMTLGGVSNALNTVSIDSDSGDIELLASNTAGTITIRGEVTTFVDNSAGATVTTAFLATQADIDNLKNFDPATDQVIVATNNDKTDYGILDSDKDILVDKVWDEPLTGANHNDPTSAGRRLRQASVWTSAEGTLTGTPTTTSFVTSLTQTTDNFYNDQTFVMVSGVLAGEARIVIDYDGTTKTVTFDEPWVLAPSASDEFAILADHVHAISQVALGVDLAITANHGSGSYQTADVSGLATEANATTNKNEIISEVDEIPTNPLLDNDARLNNLDVAVSSRSTFDNTSDEVITDTASRNASKATGFATPTNVSDSETVVTNAIDAQTVSIKGGDDRDNTEVYDKAGPADTSALATKNNQAAINEGVKKASLIIPYTDDLPDS